MKKHKFIATGEHTNGPESIEFLKCEKCGQHCIARESSQYKGYLVADLKAGSIYYYSYRTSEKKRHNMWCKFTNKAWLVKNIIE